MISRTIGYFRVAEYPDARLVPNNPARIGPFGCGASLPRNHVNSGFKVRKACPLKGSLMQQKRLSKPT